MLRDELIKQRQDTKDDIEQNLKALREASSQGDRSENQDFTTATEKAHNLQIQLSQVEMQLNEMSKVRMEDKYKHIGMIVYYTTVQLYIPSMDKRMVVKMYPGKISDISKGILAEECAIGRAIWKREKGDTVYVTEQTTGEELKYVIEDFY